MSDDNGSDAPLALIAELVEPKPMRGRPFQKGISGNPGGRPKRELEAVRKAARSHGVEAIERLVSLMRNGSDKVAFLACEALLARGFGRPAQTVDLDGTARPSAVGIIILPPVEDTGNG